MLRHSLVSSLVIHLVSLSSFIPSTVAQDYSGTGYVISVPKDRYYHEDVGETVYNSKPYISGEKKPDTFSHSLVSPPEYDNTPDYDKKVTVVPRHVGIFSRSKEDSYPSVPYSPEYNKEADDSSDGPHVTDIFGDYKEDSKPSLPYSSEYNNEPDTSREVSSYNKPDVFGRKKPDIDNSPKTSYPSLPYPSEYNKGPDVSKDVPQYVKPFTSRRRKPDTYSRPEGNSRPSLPYPRDYDDNFADDNKKFGRIPQPSKPDISGKKKPDVFKRSYETPTSFSSYPPNYDQKDDDRSRRPQQPYNHQDYRQQNPSGFKYNPLDFSSTRLVKGTGKFLQDIVKDRVPALFKPLVSPFFRDNRPKKPSAFYEDGEKRYDDDDDDEKEYIPSSGDGYRRPTERESSSQYKKGANPFNLLESITSFFPKTKKY